jgi:cell division protein ZapA
MPEVTIKIGERPFKVACPDGEESQLEAARAILNAEAQVLVAHAGRMPEAQMLLMSGLMLADRAIALEEKVKAVEAEIELMRQILEDTPPEIKTLTKEVEVAVIPAELLESLAELSARAESAADNLEEKAAQPVA